MTEGRERTEHRLERLKVATEGVGARRDFAARVNAALLREAKGDDWFSDLVTAARRFVLVAALAAVLGVTWAVNAQRAASEMQASGASAELDLQW